MQIIIKEGAPTSVAFYSYNYTPTFRSKGQSTVCEINGRLIDKIYRKYARSIVT